MNGRWITTTFTLGLGLSACGIAQSLLQGGGGDGEAKPAEAAEAPAPEPVARAPELNFVTEDPIAEGHRALIGRVVFTSSPDDGLDPSRHLTSAPFGKSLYYRIVAERSRENLIRQTTGHACVEAWDEMRFVQIDGHPVPFPDVRDKPYAYFLARVPKEEWSARTTWQSEELFGWKSAEPHLEASRGFRDDVAPWLTPGKHALSLKIVARCRGDRPGHIDRSDVRAVVAEGQVEIVVAAGEPARYVKATYEPDRFASRLADAAARADLTLFAQRNAKYKALTLRGIYPRGSWVVVRNDLGIITHRALTMDLVFAPDPGQAACRLGVIDVEAPHLGGGKFDRVQVAHATEPEWVSCAVVR